MVKIVVSANKGKQVLELEFNGKLPVSDLKKELVAKIGVQPLRQRITQTSNNEVWKDQNTVGTYTDMIDSQVVEVSIKDLGPQLPYLCLFLMEYGVPLLIMPFIFWASGNRSNTAQFAFVMGVVHYAKRCIESVTVHIFSNASVPVSGSIKNFIHYWFLYATIVSLDVFVFGKGRAEWSHTVLRLLSALCLIFEFCNFACHRILRDLRIGKDGKVDPYARGIPSGFGFDTVVCANYLYEILFWCTYTIATGSPACLVFTAFGAYIMVVWAAGKKKKLLQHYKDDDKESKAIRRRKLVFPYVL